jgi:dipeptidyl aminopeptidase/acylaminoacyl peptidase
VCYTADSRYGSKPLPQKSKILLVSRSLVSTFLTPAHRDPQHDFGNECLVTPKLDISSNVGAVKHFLSTLLQRLKRVIPLPSSGVSLIGPGPVRFVRNRPKHLFDPNFDQDYFFGLPLPRKRDAPSRARPFAARHVRYQAAMRRMVGLDAGNDLVARVQSDGSHFGTIWVTDRAGQARVLVDPNPQTAKWSAAWTQEVVRWKSGDGEELQGVLVRPAGSGRLPLSVDPYSSWRNRFLNIPVLGNYAFVKAGFAVFFPDHRAPHTFPETVFDRLMSAPQRIEIRWTS